MKRVIVLTAALAASTAFADWVYFGQWGGEGSYEGDFKSPEGIAIAPGGRVYVVDTGNDRIQYFTWDGSFLGKWGSTGSANGQFYEPCSAGAYRDLVFVLDRSSCRVQRFTLNGSFLGKWGKYGDGNGEFSNPDGLAVSSRGNVYVADANNDRVQYFNSQGSFLGKWDAPYPWYDLRDVAVAPNGNVYVTFDSTVVYYTPTGSQLGSWRLAYRECEGIDVAPNGYVYLTNSYNRVEYYTAVGSFLGSWGRGGSSAGQFRDPYDVAVSPDGGRCYVVEMGNHRVQYFRWSDPAVVPASVGRVKALFR